MVSVKKILPLALTLLLICGCSQKDFGERHHNYTLGISLCVPTNWKRAVLSPAADLTSMAFEDEQKATVIVTQNHEDSLERQLKIAFEMNYPVLKSGPLPFSKYKTKWLLSDKDQVTTVTYVLKDKAGHIFSIIGTSPSLNFVSYRYLFDKIVRSFDSY